MNKKLSRQLINFISILGLIATLFITYEFLKLGIFRDLNKLQTLLDKTHGFAPFIFIFIQVIQVVVPIIPGGVSLAAGVLIFGPLFGFLYNYVGIVLGSIINFLLARRYGKPLIEAFVSEKVYLKYSKYLDEKDRFEKFFAIAIFFPIAPDDALCFIAGLTEMSLKKFKCL